jgi:tetratricopeptide (TPR) repeat protein
MATKYSDKSEPHYLRAVHYENEGRIEDAIREYRMANRIKKDLIPARKRLGDLFIRMGRVDEAVQQYQKATEITSQKRKWKRILVPDEDKYSLVQVLNALAYAYQCLDQPRRVEEVWERMVQTAPLQPGDGEIIEMARQHLKHEEVENTGEIPE